jgi:hypothetical protein
LNNCSTVELRNCPFCGSDDIDLFENNDIQCSNCGVAIPYVCVDTDTDTVTTWNRRTPGWISVKDELPKRGERVLAMQSSPGARYLIVYIDDEIRTQQWRNDCDDIRCRDITHWMPLPEPPQAVK